MQKIRIVTEPHPTLRTHAKPVPKEEFGSKKLLDIIEKMAAALRATDDGIGIAAPQIGISKRIFLASEEALAMDKGISTEELNQKKKNWQYHVFINPEILKLSVKKNKSDEGCLSVPKKYGVVERADKIRVCAQDEYGRVFERGASKLFARLLQHEIDHLNGTLFIDKALEIHATNSNQQ